MNTGTMLARCAVERARIERGGGPIPQHRAAYLAACGVVDKATEMLGSGMGLGVLPFLPLLGYAMAALVGTATVIGGIAIVNTAGVATTAAGNLVRALGVIATAGAAVWAAARLAPGVGRSVRATRAAFS